MWNAHHRKRLTECKTNLKNLGSAMEMYSADWAGHYPTSLDKLTPKYLERIPTCPNSNGQYQVQVGPNAQGNESRLEDYYYIYCHGENHNGAGLSKDQPALPSAAILGER